MSIESRLIEYGKSLLEPGQESYMPAATVLHRVKVMQENSGARPCGFAYDMIEVEGENVACMPDGGLGAMVERMAASIEHGRRCAEMAEAVLSLPPDYMTFVQTVYCGPSMRDIPRKPKATMDMLKITPRAYYWRRDKLFAWLEDRLCLAVRKVA